MTSPTSRAPDRRSLRSFGLILGALWLAFFGLALPWRGGSSYPSWPWVVAAGLWSAALLWPSALAPVHRAWTALGHLLGWANTRLLLGLVFYVGVTPFGLAMRALGCDPLARRFQPETDSYRIPRHGEGPAHMERPY